jgi:DNA-binding NarL/FixJ family response regulator
MMQHWICDSETRPIPTWLQAMPEAKLLGRGQLNGIPANEPGILWFRLRAGEVVGDALPRIGLGEGQHLVLLCDDPDEAVVMQALTAGASGCCNTHAAPEVLNQVAMVVGNGGLWVGQSLLQRLVGSTSRILGQRPAEAKIDGWAGRLSERETQVARQVAGGASNKEIASQLSISERTVKAHLTSIFEKLGLRDRLQLSLKINGMTI